MGLAIGCRGGLARRSLQFRPARAAASGAFSSPLGSKLSKEERETIRRQDPKDRILRHDGDTFHPIFRYNGIVFVAGLSKLKVTLTAFTSAFGLVSVVSGNPQLLDTSYFGLLAFSTCTTLAVGEFFRRTVGFIYLNEDATLIRVGRVTFWGRRRDFNVPVRDVVPLTETDDGVSDSGFWQLRFYDDSPTYKTEARSMIAFGKNRSVLDEEKFKLVFGNVDLGGKKRR